MFIKLFSPVILRQLVMIACLHPAIVYSYNCVLSVNPTTPNDRFQVNGDNTISDLSTGLMWQRCSVGFSGAACDIGSVKTFNWLQVLQEVGLINEINQPMKNMGYSDWRLPNINELASIVEEACYEPAVNLGIFPDTFMSKYWTSSIRVTDSTQIWTVNFIEGSVSEISRINDDHYLRLVRD